jgi:hypothetical protein
MKRGEPPPQPDRTPAIVMSVLGAAALGYGGITTLLDHTITWPGRSGAAMRVTGANADLMAWVLLAGATACVSFFAQALAPGRKGLKITGAAFAVWAVAAAVYFAAQ